MILEITIRHSFFGGDTKEQLYIGPDELEAGADIASHLNDTDRALLTPFTARYVDSDTIEISCCDKTCRYSVREESRFASPWISVPRPDVQIEGRSYDNDHEVCATVRLLPFIQPSGDPESKTIVINEWDEIEGKPLSIRVDSSYLRDAETDAEAACLLAESVQAQYPEALEVIARYMRVAYDLGSADAEEWLKDYLSDDGRFDAYC